MIRQLKTYAISCFLHPSKEELLNAYSKKEARLLIQAKGWTSEKESDGVKDFCPECVKERAW